MSNNDLNLHPRLHMALLAYIFGNYCGRQPNAWCTNGGFIPHPA
jgi:hypothetical protein